MFAGGLNKSALSAPNIRFLEWAPQNDVLGHSSVKAFVTHAGSNSVYEAAFHGKPVVCIPVMGDQFDEAARVSCRNYFALALCTSGHSSRS